MTTATLRELRRMIIGTPPLSTNPRLKNPPSSSDQNTAPPKRARGTRSTYMDWTTDPRTSTAPSPASSLISSKLTDGGVAGSHWRAAAASSIPSDSSTVMVTSAVAWLPVWSTTV